jgi:UDP-N-acetylglucosamine 2-epimerase (non-hydrolysing)
MTKTITHVVGARPNYMKIAPLMEALDGVSGVRQMLVNTGQHYDEAMSGVFMRELRLPTPDRNLGVGSGSHAVQTAKVMMAFEEVCLETSPDLIVVVGDVNSTMAAALVGAKLRIPVAHVEAGLRSFDREMPEEINRLVTDAIADLLLTPSADGDENLRREGVPQEKIFRVGNIMIDTLEKHLPHATFDRVRDRFPISPQGYAVVTLHRPSNVDHPDTLAGIVGALAEIGRQMPVVFPVHPRTRARLEASGIGLEGVLLVEPLGYLDFLSLTSNARIVLTDSGGLQEETTALGIPCLTLRENTERPITVTDGTNELVGPDPARILDGFHRAMRRTGTPRRPDLWDGHTAPRIARVLRTHLGV